MIEIVEEIDLYSNIHMHRCSNRNTRYGSTTVMTENSTKNVSRRTMCCMYAHQVQKVDSHTQI